jgi:transposase-like protein
MAKSKAPTLRQFQDRFPTEDSCLDHLFQVRYGTDFDCPKCDRPARYSRVKARRSYQCQWCAHQLYPTAGTPFDRTRTPLRDWFYVMFLFTTTRNGVAAKRVERELGVTYKTAWRMCSQIRAYMAALDSDDPIGGVGEIVEIDETLVGGVVRGKGQGPHLENKAIVLGMLEKGGELITRVVPSRREHHLRPIIQYHVLPGTSVYTDQSNSHQNLGECGYRHSRVNHKIHEYVGPMGETVNRLEGFWAMLKRGIVGTHIHVSAKHLPKYLGEFEYRWNMRSVPHLMLDRLMHSFER